MKTYTVKQIPDDTYRDLRIRAAERGISINKMILEAIKMCLREKEVVMSILKIEETMQAAQKEWTASDGGLTMTASDLLHFGQVVIKKIKAGDREWVLGLDPMEANTGSEGDIIDAALEWAHSVG